MHPAQQAIAALGPIDSHVLTAMSCMSTTPFGSGPSSLPSAEQPWHRHLLAYLIVPLTGGDIEIESVAGVIRRPKEMVGEVMWREAGEVHELRNAGSSVYRNILVELKSIANKAPSR
jgi:hypothetical protein